MTKVTLHESYVLVETDDISFTDLRAAVALYNELETELSNNQLMLSDTVENS